MKFTLGKAYYLKFYDHFLGNDNDQLECEIFGWLLQEDDLYLQLAYWKTNSKLEDHKTEAENYEKMKILKSTITKSKVIKL
jgi:hypothetical protein